jgi:uncharacterized protein (TIGR00251 family)
VSVPPVTIAVRVSPRSGRDEVAGVTDDGELNVRVRAAAVDGAATRAALRLIASELGLPASSVELVSGAASRHKRMRLRGVDVVCLRERWPGLSVR